MNKELKIKLSPVSMMEFCETKITLNDMSKEDKEIDWVYSPDDILEEWNKQVIELFIYENECLLKAANRWKNNNIKDMEKKQPTRDSKGRFMKKENKKAFDYEVAYKEQKEAIAILTKERDVYKNRADKTYDYSLILLDALRAAAAEVDWLKDRIPFWRKLFLREEMHEWDEYFESLCSKAEGLDKE